MSRRSTRLLSGGYYNSDEESDSSSVTTISYKENPVKVFKKKSGSHKKKASPVVSPVSSTARAEQQQEGWSPVSRPALRSPASVSAAASAPGPSSPSPARSTRPILHFKLHSEPTQGAVDSSGYSSSEDPYRKPSSRSGPVSRAGPGAEYREWMSGAVSRLKDTVAAAVGAVQARVLQQARSGTALTATSPSSARMKTLCGLLLLLLLVLLGVWLLWPWWIYLFSGSSIMSVPSQTVVPQAPGSQPTTALDPAAVSAAVEAKMQHILKELQLKHELLLAEVRQQVRMDLQALRQRSSQEQVEHSLSELRSRLEQHQTLSETTAASLSLRVTAMEEQVSQMEQRADPTTPPKLTTELEQAVDKWVTQRLQEHHAAAETRGCWNCGRPLADTMADFALESQGASVVSTRCSETYRTRSACVTLFGLPLWYPSESPRTVIQGPAVLFAGKCWAFHGVQGTLVIALSHPIKISHVTLDHLPRHNSPTGRIDSAPKDFEVYGMKNEAEEGTLLGLFTYCEDGEPTQTFSLSGPTDEVYNLVELRVLSNWGHVQYTCVYRFRVHGQMAST